MENQNDPSQQRPDTPKASFQTLKPLTELLPLALTSTERPENFGTGQRQEITDTSIGKPPSEIILTELRKNAMSVKSGNLLNDQTLETLLAQHFGPQRLCVKRVGHDVYGPDGYDYVIDKVTVRLDELADCEMKLFEALEFFNRPAPVDFVARKCAELRAVMARTRESQDDIQTTIEVYSAHLSQYPPDVVAFVIDKTIATKKWFPLVTELRAEMEELVRLRRAVLSAFEKCRNPLLSNRAAQAIAFKAEEETPKPTKDDKDFVTQLLREAGINAQEEA